MLPEAFMLLQSKRNGTHDVTMFKSTVYNQKHLCSCKINVMVQEGLINK